MYCVYSKLLKIANLWHRFVQTTLLGICSYCTSIYWILSWLRLPYNPHSNCPSLLEIQWYKQNFCFCTQQRILIQKQGQYIKICHSKVISRWSLFDYKYYDCDHLKSQCSTIKFIFKQCKVFPFFAWNKQDTHFYTNNIDTFRSSKILFILKKVFKNVTE